MRNEAHPQPMLPTVGFCLPPTGDGACWNWASWFCLLWSACDVRVVDVMRKSMRARLSGAALLTLGLWSGFALAQNATFDNEGTASVGTAASASPSVIVVPPTTPADSLAAVCLELPAASPHWEPVQDIGALRSVLPDPMIALLEFADRMRSASPAERAREIARGNPPARGNGKKEAAGSNGNGNGNGLASPQQQLRLAIVLGQIRPGADLARAQQLAQQVANSAHPEAQPIKPLARLLAARMAEQRRLEEQLDRAERQLRDQRLRLARANQRLEAVRAIERSLGSAPAERPMAPSDAASAVPAGPR